MADEQMILGEAAFAAISAVEGLKLSPTSKRRLAAPAKMPISEAERRAAILKHHRTRPSA